MRLPPFVPAGTTTTAVTHPAQLPPDAGLGLPTSGIDPVALVAVGTLLLGLGLAALLVRKPPPPAVGVKAAPPVEPVGGRSRPSHRRVVTGTSSRRSWSPRRPSR